jgi:hypothetical protein
MAAALVAAGACSGATELEPGRVVLELATSAPNGIRSHPQGAHGT